MKNTLENTKKFLKKWSKKKRTYLALAIVLLVAFFVFKPKIDNSILIETVKEANLEYSVSASGKVTSNTDLSLSFNSSGVVRQMRVKVGDKVNQGAILATLDAGSTLGALTSARASLAGAKAKYEKLLQGASSEEVNLAETNLKNAQNDLENTKRSQDVLVKNAYTKFLNSGLEARSENSASTITPPEILGTYTGTQEGTYTIQLNNGGSSPYFSFSGISSGTSTVHQGLKSPLGNEGLSVLFPDSSYLNGSGVWIIDIPNKQSSSYLENLNAYNTALENKTSAVSSAQSAVDAKAASLAVVRAQARPFELDLAQSEVMSKEGDVQTAQANYENTVIRAPAAGTITQVNTKIGELAEARKEEIVLEDIDNLYIEANINEANIIKIKPDQEVSFEIDSFGPEVVMYGKVIEVDPGATITDGIVNYKIKVSILGADKEIRPGMNADIKVLISKKNNVLVVPKLAVITKDGKSYVRVITDEKHRKYEEREVRVGMTGDGNLQEVVNGLHNGEKIALVSLK